MTDSDNNQQAMLGVLETYAVLRRVASSANRVQLSPDGPPETAERQGQLHLLCCRRRTTRQKTPTVLAASIDTVQRRRW